MLCDVSMFVVEVYVANVGLQRDAEWSLGQMDLHLSWSVAADLSCLCLQVQGVFLENISGHILFGSVVLHT